MAARSEAEPRSAILLFLKKNWKWLLVVILVAVFVMMVASD
jgi:predicted negative regulator of RcsB-dependent stress response